MAHIVLHGDLESFGGPFDFDVSSPAEAIRALCSQLKGFRFRLGQGHFRVTRKGIFGARDLPLAAMTTRLKAGHELHIVPVIEGSGKSAGKIILGVALAGAAVAFAPALTAAGPMLDGTAGFAASGTFDLGATAFSIPGIGGITFGQIAGFGASMILGGVSQMLSPTPKFNAGSAGPLNPGGLFGGPANVAQQGSAVPLVYGRFIAGSVVISSSLDPENSTI